MKGKLRWIAKIYIVKRIRFDIEKEMSGRNVLVEVEVIGNKFTNIFTLKKIIIKKIINFYRSFIKQPLVMSCEFHFWFIAIFDFG